MRTKNRLAKGILIALGIALIPINAAAAEKVTPSTACKILNQKVLSQKKTFTCVKLGKKMVWNKGVVIVKSLPASAPLPAPTPAPEPTVTSTDSSVETPAPASTCSRNKNALKNC